MQPYVEPTLKVLIPKAKDPSPGVSSKVLVAIGELSQVGGESMLPYLDDILPIIIETLQDQSSAMKREAALKTLGQVTSSTGVAIMPYVKYPNLLNLLISILKSEQSVVLRQETVKVIGILGALDPYRHKVRKRKNVVCICNDERLFLLRWCPFRVHQGVELMLRFFLFRRDSALLQRITILL
jgi:FKBP12-rapamycin complex-associated protein